MVVYLVTLAPGVTFWDPGEFIAAVHTLGIPHPPGTPLYILIGKAWTLLLPVGPALALNVFSAFCTAAAAAVTARFVLRSTGERWSAVVAALVAGTMSTVWFSATEAEVYAPALLLSVLIIECADQARMRQSWRWLVLTAYLAALTVPLHLSALIALPAAIVLAAEPISHVAERLRQAKTSRLARVMQTSFPDWQWSWALTLIAVTVLAVAASGASWVMALVGLLLLGVAVALETSRAGWKSSSILVAVAIALSALAFMIVRAAHDPGINQGDPSTLARWLAVITREQYAAARMWPRQAPLWIQLGNMLQYFDWQLALSLAPDPPISPGRAVATIAGVVLAVIGARAHRQSDPRRWRAVLALLLAGSVGVMIYLNLKAGPSIGWGILPDSMPHEPRERDYFFVLAFWAWAIWIGIGMASVAQRLRWPSWTALAVAALPVVFNWKVVERRSEPLASLPRLTALALLSSAPPRAVLFVAGDNDSYPLWYVQQVENFRRDVSVVTIPIIPAQWYQAELARRHGLTAPATWSGLSETMRALAASARGQKRPVAAAVSVAPRERAALGDLHVLRGWVWVEADSLARATSLALLSVHVANAIGTAGLSSEDRAAILQLSEPVSAATRKSANSTERYVLGLLACPRLGRESSTRAAAADSLDSTCNFR